MRIKVKEEKPENTPEDEKEEPPRESGEKRSEKKGAGAFPTEGGKLAKKELPRRKKDDETAELRKMVDNLTEELKKREAELVTAEERVMRAAADAENFKKRLQREREEESRYANVSLVEALLPALDNFEQAIAAAKSGETDMASLTEGVDMVSRQIMDVLRRRGLDRVEAVGRPFDPETMEAVRLLESGEHEDGEVVEEYIPGYRFKDRVIRPAKVRVAKNTGESEDESE
ncbi:MAG: nucleotide exchange factor GrpE [Candidatus Nitrospinota bacterium M3_3B_026]